MANNSGKIATGAAIGAVVGFVAGILLAPKSGKETREDIKNAANKAIKIAEEKLRHIHEDLSKLVEKAETQVKKAGAKIQNEAKEALDNAKKTRDQAANVLAAVRSGNSSDEDLDIAIKNAQSSLDSLKKYFKK